MKLKYIFIYITCPNKKLALQISKNLLKKSLVACANILPNMESVYLWKAEFCHDKEVVLILKTRKANFKKIESAIKSMHPYDCPCIVALPIIAGSKSYLDWLSLNTARRKPS